MRRKMLFGVLVVVLLVGMILAGCAKPAAPTAKEPVKIGVITWRTGIMKWGGDDYVRGVKLAVKEIHEQGGILGGRQIELTDYDETFTAEGATSAVKEAIAHGCKGLVAFTSSGTAEAGAAAVERYGLPLVVPTSGSAKVAIDGYYGLAHLMFYQELEMAACARFVEAQGWKTAIQVAFDSTYSRYCEAALHALWDQPGSPVKLLPSIYIAYGAADATLEVTKAAGEKTDVMFLHIWGKEVVVPAFERLQELGYEGGLIGCTQLLDTPYCEALGKFGEGAYAPMSWSKDPNVPESIKYADSYLAEFGVESGAIGEGAYEGAKLLLLAMDKAGTDSDLEKIADAMHSLHFMTPRGEEMRLIKRRSGGGEVFERICFVQSQDGKPVVVDYLPLTLEDYDEDKITY